MACFAVNGLPPDPPRLWSRAQGRCSESNNSTNSSNSSDSSDSTGFIYLPETGKYITIQEYADIIAMLNKGNVLQYKKNSSNITKQQRYAQIAKMQWTNRTKTWASQSVTATMPNTQSLKRVNYDTIYLDDGSPAIGPITCPNPAAPTIPSALPTNPNIRPDSIQINDNQLGIRPTLCPIYVTPPPGPVVPSSGPYPQLPRRPVNPIIVPVLPVINPPIGSMPRIVIPNGGQLICNVIQNICTGEIYSKSAVSHYNPTSASGVPGPIIELFYNSATQPTYYPRQQGTVFGTNGNVWPTQKELLSMLQSPINNTSQPCDSNLTKALAKLYQNVGDDLETLFTYFSIGDVGILKEKLTYEVYQNLATLLLSSRYPVDINYTNVLGIIQIGLEGLYQSLLLASTQQQEIARLNKLLKDSSSGSLNGIKSLSVSADLNIVARIRPEIKLYIQLHGYPANGIFDADKINQIKATLGIA